MSYGSDANAMSKEYLESDIRDFLETHTISELLEIVGNAIERAQDERH